MTDKAIEQEIQAKGLTAPRVTPADIEANIVGERYFTAADSGRAVTKEIVDRFLSWKLPEAFHPDAGISFKAEYNEGTPYPMKHEPLGTNLFHAEQVKEMLEHVLQPAPDSQAMHLLTFCVLELRNGFTVTGESACASPENFDAELGRKIARQNAVSKMWPLLGYHLRTMLKRQEEAAELRAEHGKVG
jgi:hypothetical protein